MAVHRDHDDPHRLEYANPQTVALFGYEQEEWTATWRERLHPDDRERYEAAKRAAVPGGGHVMDYNARKQDTIRAIYDRLFHAAGLLPRADAS